jgi:hypothetical protein
VLAVGLSFQAETNHSRQVIINARIALTKIKNKEEINLLLKNKNGE